ncbi:MAG: hypothetical protein C0179_03395 [Fervidicoccus sp.]|nr:MAG: hypothetical protein C0179_03395 [Fervidicoccus sp.]
MNRFKAQLPTLLVAMKRDPGRVIPDLVLDHIAESWNSAFSYGSAKMRALRTDLCSKHELTSGALGRGLRILPKNSSK